MVERSIKVYSYEHYNYTRIAGLLEYFKLKGERDINALEELEDLDDGEYMVSLSIFIQALCIWGGDLDSTQHKLDEEQRSVACHIAVRLSMPAKRKYDSRSILGGGV